MKITGGCHCGNVTFEAEVDPANTSICHCADCQTLSGAPYRASVAARPEQFRFVSGKPATYVKVAESGNKRVQAFCANCGSPIYSTALEDAKAALNIRVGTIQQRDALVPTRQIWTRSRQPWTADLSGIPEGG